MNFLIRFRLDIWLASNRGARIVDLEAVEIPAAIDARAEEIVGGASGVRGAGGEDGLGLRAGRGGSDHARQQGRGRDGLGGCHCAADIWRDDRAGGGSRFGGENRGRRPWNGLGRGRNDSHDLVPL